jgi:hypothetical protein
MDQIVGCVDTNRCASDRLNVVKIACDDFDSLAITPGKSSKLLRTANQAANRKSLIKKFRD